MELKSRKKLYSGKWREIVFLLALGAFAVGCNRGDSGSGQPVAQSPYANGALWNADISMCQGCFPNAQPLLVGVKASNNAGTMLMSMDLLGDPMRANIIDPNAVQFYNGPIMVVGTLRITTPDWITCGATAGDYTIRTITPGLMGSTLINNLAVDAFSPTGARLTMRMNMVTLYNDSGAGLNRTTEQNRAGMNIIVDFINGAACGSSFTTF